MRLPQLLLAASLAFPISALAQTSAPKPTVAEAQAFMDKAEADLLDLSNEASHAGWLQETDIPDDSEAVPPKANEPPPPRTNQIVIEARHFDNLTLPPDLARKFMLL